jgi:hypothetical protein
MYIQLNLQLSEMFFYLKFCDLMATVVDFINLDFRYNYITNICLQLGTLPNLFLLDMMY